MSSFTSKENMRAIGQLALVILTAKFNEELDISNICLTTNVRLNKTIMTRNIALGECIPPPTHLKIKVKGQIQDHTIPSIHNLQYEIYRKYLQHI